MICLICLDDPFYMHLSYMIRNTWSAWSIFALVICMYHLNCFYRWEYWDHYSLSFTISLSRPLYTNLFYIFFCFGTLCLVLLIFVRTYSLNNDKSYLSISELIYSYIFISFSFSFFCIKVFIYTYEMWCEVIL